MPALDDLNKAVSDGNALLAEVVDGLNKLAASGETVSASSVQQIADNLSAAVATNKTTIEAAFAGLGVAEPAPGNPPTA
jgi:hypothetical protein